MIVFYIEVCTVAVYFSKPLVVVPAAGN